jgi:opacity protein-like surface antigen
MKKIICLVGGLFLMVASNVYAVLVYESGPYFGGQIGWGRLDEGNGYKQYINGNTQLGNFTAWRAYGGYSFNPILSVEAGYSSYPDNKYSGTSSINVKAYTIDLVGKVTIPLSKLPGVLSYFSIYGKGGAAYANTKISGLIVKAKETVMPTYGAGIIFNFTDNIAVDASWTSVLGRNYVENSNDVITGKVPAPTGHMFTLGLSYKITGIF